MRVLVRVSTWSDGGTMEDFRALVRLAHSKGMAVISFDNLGSCSSEAPEFLKAVRSVHINAAKETNAARAAAEVTE